jgi:hypothetical protein
MRRVDTIVDVPRLVTDLEKHGAYFRQTSGGAWILEQGRGLPGWLVDVFFSADERVLSAYLRHRAHRNDDKKRGDMAA